jgi:hypothetical protein
LHSRSGLLAKLASTVEDLRDRASRDTGESGDVSHRRRGGAD